ncbi:MAG TPA: PEP-CTERM sorting domain-containing protein [Bryobacteraceae bacterium]|nr:PEP-CTERM sorting domain-containing protein [Bryobacteraceae bacterium]
MVLDSSINFNGSGTIFNLPLSGGAPTTFVNLGSMLPVGGLFLPGNYGALAGSLLVAGLNTSSGVVDELLTVNASGVVTPLEMGQTASIFGDVALAPAGFDGVGGQVVLADEDGDLYTLNTNGNVSELYGGDVGGLPFGVAFAPGDFGGFAGDLFFTDGSTIEMMNAAGQTGLFADVILGYGQSGLRQIAFAPAGFGAYGGDLFVSVSGSNAGGGTGGAVDVFNPAGQLVAILAGSGTPFDPRGIYFPSDQRVLISDSDPSILSATPADFSPVPEPSAVLLMLPAAALVVWKRRRAH